VIGKSKYHGKSSGNSPRYLYRHVCFHIKALLRVRCPKATTIANSSISFSTLSRAFVTTVTGTQPAQQRAREQLKSHEQCASKVRGRRSSSSEQNFLAPKCLAKSIIFGEIRGAQTETIKRWHSPSVQLSPYPKSPHFLPSLLHLPVGEPPCLLQTLY
jgi:hypothetical protein